MPPQGETAQSACLTSHLTWVPWPGPVYTAGRAWYDEGMRKGGDGMRQRIRLFVSLLLCALVLAGCTQSLPTVQSRLCDVMIEDGPGFRALRSIVTVRSGEDARFQLVPEAGCTFVSADYADYEVRTSGGQQTLILHNVRYPAVVRVTYRPGARQLCYHGNGGLTAAGEETAVLPVADGKLRGNTSQGIDLFQRGGCTLYAWNTRPDGSGTQIGLGSRTRIPDGGGHLYAMWEPWSDEELFTAQEGSGGLFLTGFAGEADTLCIPSVIRGQMVTGIASGAFAHCASRVVILPPTLREIGADAFQGAAVEELYLYDSLTRLDPQAFPGCASLARLHINAATPPRYMTYFATFADKHDRLLSLKDHAKIVLFSGSSARFGIDSPLLDESFPEYDVVNMGVFAYTNARPQLEIILSCMQAGDVLLHAPEFDASNYQFCTDNVLSHTLFSMMEANYDALTLLDLRTYEQVIPALSAYLSIRTGLAEGSYAFSPSDFDEDGNPSDTPAYNACGDYILYRPNAPFSTPVYGLPVQYTVEAFTREPFAASINAVYDRFLAAGIRVWFSYAPRNIEALSADSTKEARAALDAWFRRTLHARVVSDLEESLFSGIYLYGTDNHLSTEGVAIHTRRLIRDLQKAFAEEAGS